MITINRMDTRARPLSAEGVNPGFPFRWFHLRPRAKRAGDVSFGLRVFAALDVRPLNNALDDLFLHRIVVLMLHFLAAMQPRRVQPRRNPQSAQYLNPPLAVVSICSLRCSLAAATVAVAIASARVAWKPSV